MKVYDVGKWFKVTYHNEGIKHFKSLPKDLVSAYCVFCLYNGRIHREDGPALMYIDRDGQHSHGEYYLHGYCMRKEEWQDVISEWQFLGISEES